jgi:hypothetical protein
VALRALLGKDVGGLSATTVGRLKEIGGDCALDQALSPRQAHSNKYRFSLADTVRLGREAQPPVRNVAGDEVSQTGLEDGDFATLERCDPRRILIDTGDAVTEIGETSS